MSRIACVAGYATISGRETAPTRQWGVHGTDLGILFAGGRQFAPAGRDSLWVGALFGDTFATPTPDYDGSAEGWRSPVLGRTSNEDFARTGVRFDTFAGGDEATQIWDYRHIGPGGRVGGRDLDCFTIIPSDAIQLPDDTYVATGFRVGDWDARGDQRMCHTLSAAWFVSNEPHAETWAPLRADGGVLGRFGRRGPCEWVNDGRDALFQNTTLLMPPGDDHLYVFGSHGGRLAGDASGIFLRRVRVGGRDSCAGAIADAGAWEFWSFDGDRWAWGADVEPTPILLPLTPRAPIGELNARVIGGRVVLTYVDDTGVIAHVADRPDAPWSPPHIVIPRRAVPTMYAPSLHPWSASLSDAHINLSEWNRDESGRTTDYAVFGHQVNLVNDLTLDDIDGPMLDTHAMSPEDAEAAIAQIEQASLEANGG